MPGGHCPSPAADGAIAGGGVGLSRRASTEAPARRIATRKRRWQTRVDVVAIVADACLLLTVDGGVAAVEVCANWEGGIYRGRHGHFGSFCASSRSPYVAD
jgi:hypothetical protein